MKHISAKNITGRLEIASLALVITCALAGCPSPATPVATPTFSPPAGTYNSDQSVTMTCSTEQVIIYYTTDGTDPKTSSDVYKGAIEVAGDGSTMTIKALATKPWMNASAVEATYTIHYSGTLDDGFAAGIGANDMVGPVVVQSDGKILIGGPFTAYDGTDRGHVARLNTDGSLDTGFLATGAGADNLTSSSVVSSVAVQGDGKILICGDFTTYNGVSRGHVARLNADGSLDTGFLATGAGADGYVFSIAVQSDGKILISGGFTAYNGTSRGYVARLDADGSLDTGFLATGAGADGYVLSIAVQSDGKILVGGLFSTFNGTIQPSMARLNTDGSLDTGFLATGVTAFQYIGSIVVQSDGKILIGGGTLFSSGGFVARLNTDGSTDADFITDDANDVVNSVKVQSDGKILIGGKFATYNEIGRGYVARLNADGSLDTGFLSTVAGPNSFVNAVAVQTDGAILIGGNFSACNGTSRGRVARLWN